MKSCPSCSCKVHPAFSAGGSTRSTRYPTETFFPRRRQSFSPRLLPACLPSANFRLVGSRCAPLRYRQEVEEEECQRACANASSACQNPYLRAVMRTRGARAMKNQAESVGKNPAKRCAVTPLPSRCPSDSITVSLIGFVQLVIHRDSCWAAHSAGTWCAHTLTHTHRIQSVSWRKLTHTCRHGAVGGKKLSILLSLSLFRASRPVSPPRRTGGLHLQRVRSAALPSPFIMSIKHVHCGSFFPQSRL